MFGTQGDRSVRPGRRLSFTQAKYFNMLWDGPGGQDSPSDCVSPGKVPTPRFEENPMELPRLPRSRRVTMISPPDTRPFSSLGYSRIDSDVECLPWQASVAAGRRSWLGSKLERKLRNPTSCDSINYEMRKLQSRRRFLTCLLMMIAWCIFLIFLGYLWDSKMPSERGAMTSLVLEKGHLFLLGHTEMIVAIAGGMLYSQGYSNIRSAREAMVHVHHSCITTSYAFLKTLRDNRRSVSELQPLIYECLALLTALPVALIHKHQGNTCEPDVTRYCQDTAMALYRLRDKGAEGSANEKAREMHCGISDHSNHGEFAFVDCFFEVFSLQLELEYQRHYVKSRIPSQATEHIMYNLRNHFENIVDWGNMHERRTPIVRENADLLALASRQGHISARIDCQPSAMLGVIELCIYLIAFAIPLQFGDICQVDLQAAGDEAPMFNGRRLIMHILLSSTASAILLTLLQELRAMWDPYGRGINTYAFTLGIASEIDTMLNEFYEVDDKVIVRKQSYYCPADDHFSRCSSLNRSSPDSSPQDDASRRAMYSPSRNLSGEGGGTGSRPHAYSV